MLALTIIVSGCGKEENPSAKLWGYIDKSGKLVIKPQYDIAGGFSNGLAEVSNSIYVDGHGKPAPPNAGDFHYKYGLIDRTGKVVVPLDYESMDIEGQVGILTKSIEPPKIFAWTPKGINEVPIHLKKFGFYSSGLCGGTLDGRLWGYFDLDGHWKIKPQFKEADKFSNGFAEADGFIIDCSGKKIFKVPSGFEFLSFGNGYFRFVSDDAAGFTNRQGKFVIGPFKGMYANDFSDGLALIRPRDQNEKLSQGEALKEGSCFFVDRTGKVVLRPAVLDAGDFSEGLSPVLSASGEGYIDKKGKLVIDDRNYYQLGPFHEGLAYVHTRSVSKYLGLYRPEGYINNKGEMVLEPKYGVVGNFSEGLAAVGFNDKMLHELDR